MFFVRIITFTTLAAKISETMKYARFGFFILLTLFFNLLTSAQSAPPEQTKVPKVVVGIVVENMRPDYVKRYWNKFGENGFKKLYSQGTVCTNVRLTQHVQNYASGTATLFTGVNPSMHGIVNKNWYDQFREKETECTEDEYYITVGSDTKEGNASPKKLLSSTVTDNLKIFSMGKSKVFSVAINRESAIFSAGHAADGAYWFDVESGRMISSSFYVNNFPDWVRLFNSENYAEKYSYRNWTTLLPEVTYTESVRDDYLLEKGYFGKYNIFPHTISKYINETKDFRPFKTTPSANIMIKDFALQIMNNEGIGTDDYPDFLTVAFSSMDYENGSFGPASLEMEDTYLYLDWTIAELVEATQKKFGKENVLFFLTANTSASYPVDYLKEEFHLPIDHFNIESTIALLTSYLNITYGEQKWIEYYDEYQIYFDHKLLSKNKIDLNEFEIVTSDFISEFEGVLIAMPANLLERGLQANGMLEPLYRTFVRSRSGDCLFMLKEGWQPVYKFKKVNYTDQSHIPLVFYGANIRPGVLSGKYDAIDLVPTLSEILKIPLPDKCQGKVIEEVVN